MVKLRILSVLLLVFLLASLVSSTDTSIKIITIPFHIAEVTLYNDAGGFNVLERFKVSSDKYGDISLTHSGSGLEKFGVIVSVKEFDKSLFFEKSPIQYLAGDEVYIEAAPKGFKLLETPDPSEVPASTNPTTTENLNSTTSPSDTVTTPTNIENLSETETPKDVLEIKTETPTEAQGKSPFTGLTIFGEGGVITPLIMYISGGFILLVVIVVLILLLVRRARRNKGGFHHSIPKPKKDEEIKVRKLSEVIKEQQQSPTIQAMQNADQRIGNTMSNLDKQNRIHELKKKLNESRDELARLKSG